MSKITGYSVVLEKNNVPMVKPVINRYKRGAGYSYIAIGKDSKGNGMSAILSEDDAKSHIKKGDAKKGTGW